MPTKRTEAKLALIATIKRELDQSIELYTLQIAESKEKIARIQESIAYRSTEIARLRAEKERL